MVDVKSLQFLEVALLFKLTLRQYSKRKILLGAVRARLTVAKLRYKYKQKP